MVALEHNVFLKDGVVDLVVLDKDVFSNRFNGV